MDVLEDDIANTNSLVEDNLCDIKEMILVDVGIDPPKDW